VPGPPPLSLFATPPPPSPPLRRPGPSDVRVRGRGQRVFVRLGIALLLAFAPVSGTAATAGAQEPPSPADVLGYEMGERFTDAAQVRRYMEVLAEASERVSVEAYGRSVEGRPLIQVLVATPEHRRRLDEILERNRELTSPETSQERARTIAEENPAVIYFSYGVHGNESSSSEAAIWTAWDLARDAQGVAGVLESAVVVLDPVVNPDGRDRYVNWYRQARAEEPNPEPETREHDEPWPGGRYNHYLFDLNRDWTWMSQPETRARLATWERWNPQVHVDFHEMNPNSSYFFFPATPPINPLYPPYTLEWGRRFGTGNARAFDREGWLYYTGETYDLFYPGYGDSWPSLLGAIGMTYEQGGGGSAGLAYRRPDGSILTLRDRALHHRTTGAATLRTATEGRRELLLGFAAFHREVDAGLSDILLVPGDDPDRAAALVSLLRDQGIRVERAPEPFTVEAEPHRGWRSRSSFPQGTYRIPMRQRRGRLAASLLQEEIPLEAEFSYDISAWSLPYAYGVEAHTPVEAPDVAWRSAEEQGDETGEVGADAGEEAPYGYLMRPGFDGARALVRFLAEGGTALAVSDTFTLGGVGYPRGTWFLPRARNPALGEGIRTSGLSPHVTAVSTGQTDGGPDLGTAEAAPVRLPRLALVGGEGTSPTSFGAHWHFLERRLAFPLDLLDARDVSEIDLDRYDVVVLPSSRDLADALGEAGLEALRGWIERGGGLVAVDGAARELAGSVAEIDVREEPGEAEGEDEGEEEEGVLDALRTREVREDERWRASMPGTILPAELDPAHPLAYGVAADGLPRSLFVLSRGRAFEPDEAFESPIWFPQDLEEASGVVSAESLERLALGAWAVQRSRGDGHVILLADDPLFRSFWYGGFQLYLNALLLGGR